MQAFFHSLVTALGGGNWGKKIKIVHLGRVGSVCNSGIAIFPFPLFHFVVSSRELGEDKGLIMSSKRKGDLESHEENGLKEWKILERGKREVKPRIWSFFLFNLFLALLGLHCCTGFSLVVIAGLQCSDFSLRWLLLLRTMDSRPTGFSSRGSQVREHRLNSYGMQA